MTGSQNENTLVPKATQSTASASTAPESGSTSGSPSTEARRRDRRQEIWASFWMSVAITFALLGVKWLIEKTDFGRQIEAMSYDLLQHQLSSKVSAKELA